MIFGLHWLNGTASATGGSDGAVWAFYGQKQLSNNSTIFVAPQGLNNGWANTNGQDITLVDNILSLVQADLCIETTQVYAMGWSYGGAMSYALACARPSVFRAVVVYSGAQLQRLQRWHPGGRLLRDPRHARQRAQHLQRTYAARHLRQEQRVYGAEPSRTGSEQPDPHHHRLLRMPERLPGPVVGVRR